MALFIKYYHLSDLLMSNSKSQFFNFISRLPIKAKFALSFTLILVIVSFSLLTHFVSEHEKDVMVHLEKQVQSMAETLALGVGIALDSNNFIAIHEALNSAKRDENLSYVVVLDPDGIKIGGFNTKKFEDLNIKATNKYEVFKIDNTLVESIPVRFYQKNFGTLILGYSLEEFYAEINDDLYKGIVICLVILLAGVSMTVYISGLITRHLALLQKAAKEFTQGKDDIEVEIPSADEIGELGQTFNLMTKSIRNNIANLVRANKLLADEITERKAQEIALQSSQDQLRNLSRRVQSIQEEEKVRIARAIHDELGQNLTAISLEIAWLEKKIPEKGEFFLEKFKSMYALINEGIQKVQSIATELRPQILDVLGICDALKWQTREFQDRSGIQCKIEISPEKFDVNPDLAIMLFRVFQESLTNIARHSLASEVSIRFQKFENSCRLEVTDNGKGIEKEKISHPQSLGLMGMRERALLCDGELSIEGIIGQGTTITINIPINPKENNGTPKN